MQFARMERLLVVHDRAIVPAVRDEGGPAERPEGFDDGFPIRALERQVAIEIAHELAFPG